MPKYDFAHPTFKRGFVEFPEKKEDLLNILIKEAAINKINVLRSQMIISGKHYTGRIFNRMTYLEIRNNGKTTILRNKEEICKFINSITHE